MVNENFCSDKKWGPFLDPFWSKIWPFSLKNQIFGHFLRIRTSDLSKTWSETWDSCFESLNSSVVSGKILVLAVLAILGQKYIACGDNIWFWAVFGHSRPNRWWFFVNFYYLTLTLTMIISNLLQDYWSQNNHVSTFCSLHDTWGEL